MTGPRFLIVVKGSDGDLFRYLTHQFQADNPPTTVMLDRRQAPRASDEADPCWRFGFKVALARDDAATVEGPTP